MDLQPDSVEPGPVLTTNQGVAISDDEKITHFDHERIPERVVHARGAAAHGVFQVYEDLSDVTCAQIFRDPKATTPVFVRFSTVPVPDPVYGREGPLMRLWRARRRL